MSRKKIPFPFFAPFTFNKKKIKCRNGFTQIITLNRRHFMLHAIFWWDYEISIFEQKKLYEVYYYKHLNKKTNVKYKWKMKKVSIIFSCAIQSLLTFQWWFLNWGFRWKIFFAFNLMLQSRSKSKAKFM